MKVAQILSISSDHPLTMLWSQPLAMVFSSLSGTFRDLRSSFNVDGRNGDVLFPRRYNDICNHFFGIRRNAQFAFLMSWDYCRKLLWPPHIGDITTRYYAYDLLKDVKINVYKNQIGKRTCHHLLFFNFFSGFGSPELNLKLSSCRVVTKGFLKINFLGFLEAFFSTFNRLFYR